MENQDVKRTDRAKSIETPGNSIDQLIKRIEALEKIVLKKDENSIGLPRKYNYNTDPGPFPHGEGLANL